MFDELIAYFGTQEGLANFLGIDRISVTLWKVRGVIPPGRAYEIEVKTEGRFKAKDIIEGNR